MSVAKVAVACAVLSTPYWLPNRVVALRGKVFARVNGDSAMTFPNDLVGADRFEEIYSHPAANGRSRGAGLSDLFWYWLSPGPEVHQEHLEAGPRYDDVARCTLRILSGPSAELSAAAARRTASVLDELVAGRAALVRLRDLMMPVWAEFLYGLVFREPCPPEARRLIVGHARDVVTSLKCTGPRHLARRARLTRYLERRVRAGEVAHELPSSLTLQERVHYLQGTFFNTGVVQMSEAMAHVLLALARHHDVQERVAADPDDDRYLGHVLDETFRMYPLFGIAHRITTADIEVDERTTLPSGSVLCFSYPDYHATGYADPEVFDPSRWERMSARAAHHIPFGVAANRPCPAWRLSPLVMRAAVREVLARFTLDSTVSHTRSIPHAAPCLLVRRDDPLPAHHVLLVRGFLRARDRWEDLWRSLLQLGLGTWMVLDARRARLAGTYFDAQDAEPPQVCPAHPTRRA
ncbi:cytochrome P450 [Umezawaea tangerina]|uniref:cytochrome P450 n=1 Tax=Umezawaea tangerina TaxID=84725 RepID=UPI000ADFB97D|nr:cytochrome P450 [Umezawaea tangerina]